MGLRGPKPTPTKILELRGSRVPKLQRRNEPQTALEIPPCPTWLDEEGHAVWARLTQQLYELGVIAAIDQHALGRYVQLFQRWRKMETFVKQYGETYPVKDKLGAVVSFQVFPQVYLAGHLSAQLQKLEDSFGMSPSSRARVIQQGKAPAEDALGTFLAAPQRRKAR